MLAAMKLGAVLIPSTTLLTRDDLLDRIDARPASAGDRRGRGDRQVRRPAGRLRPHRRRRRRGRAGTNYRHAETRPRRSFKPDGPTRGQPIRCCSTSPRAPPPRPKLVLHTHQSYPVGHLSTMYWLGLQPGDIHLNISSPGWAKHAWSCFFAPWNAGATVFVYNFTRFNAKATARRRRAPRRHHALRAADGVAHARAGGPAPAGKPALREAGRRRRAAQSGGHRAGPRAPGASPSATATARPRPPRRSATRRASRSSRARWGGRCPAIAWRCSMPTGKEADEGELSGARRRRAARPDARLPGRRRSAPPRPCAAATTAPATWRGRDADGYLTFVGRADDVFKASDYRISPFELESVLIEHAAVAEAAVVPSPDPLRLAVPKAFVVLRRRGARRRARRRHAIFAHVREHLAPFKRVRRLEFADLPKTISGKIRRVELRRRESGAARRRPLRSGRAASAPRVLGRRIFPSCAPALAPGPASRLDCGAIQP